MLVAITVDVHGGDSPRDIPRACEWLCHHGVRATFFIPSILFGLQPFKQVLRTIVECGHQAASHTHRHDLAERRALIAGDRQELAFLSVSKAAHEDYFGAPPRAFRAPCWSRLSAAALTELSRLDYRVDSSATPQRLSIFSSTPYSDTWTFSPRRLYLIQPGLLEVPTTSFILPAGSSTFATLRRFAHWFLSPLIWEAKYVAQRVLTLQFHVDEFNPNSERPQARQKLRPVDFLLRRHRGFGFKYALLDINPQSLSARKDAIFAQVGACEFLTLAEVAEKYKAMGTEKTSA